MIIAPQNAINDAATRAEQSALKEFNDICARYNVKYTCVQNWQLAGGVQMLVSEGVAFMSNLREQKPQ